MDYSGLPPDGIANFFTLAHDFDVSIIEEGWKFYGIPIDHIKVIVSAEPGSQGSWKITGLEAINQQHWQDELTPVAYES